MTGLLAQRSITARILALLVALCAFVGSAICAPSGTAPGLLRVSDAWVRATVEGQTGSGAFMRLRSREDARLVGASSPVAEIVEIHEMRMVNDLMTMRRVESLPLPADTTVALDHGYHIMLIGLKRQLLVGQSVTITLQLLDAKGTKRAIDIVAPVRALNTPAVRSPPSHE